MATRSCFSNRFRSIAIAVSLAVLPTSPASSEVLVLVDGQSVETSGPWEVRGGLIIYTTLAGTLSSIRASLVDLEATEIANRPVTAAQDDSREIDAPALVIKQEDVGAASDATVSTARLVAHLSTLDALEARRLVEALRPSVERVVRLDLEVDILSPRGFDRTIALLESDVVRFRQLASDTSDPDLSKSFGLLASDTERFVRLARSDSEAALEEIAAGWRQLRELIGYQW